MELHESLITYRLLMEDGTIQLRTFPILNGIPIYPISWGLVEFKEFWEAQDRYSQAQYKETRRVDFRRGRNRRRWQARHNDLVRNKLEILKDPIKFREHCREKSRENRIQIMREMKAKRAYEEQLREKWLKNIVKSHNSSAPEIQKKIQKMVDDLHGLFQKEASQELMIECI